jgi:hypothetical protein
VKVYEYLGENGIRSFIFLVGPWLDSFATVKGRKRVNLKKLFLKTKLRKRNPAEKYQKPDKELLIDMIIPLDKLRDVSSKKKRI